MNADGLADGRKIYDVVTNYIRIMAVRVVRQMNLSYELIAKSYHINRSCIYRWLKKYDDGGYEAPESRMAPGAGPWITPEMDEWLRNITF